MWFKYSEYKGLYWVIVYLLKQQMKGYGKWEFFLRKKHLQT